MKQLFLRALILGIFALIASPLTAQPSEHDETERFTVLTWNIWHGGREDGEDIGPQRVVEIIKNSGADIVAMQETYGSGENISEALGYHFAERGTNVSIMSRYPFVEDISVYKEFECIGRVIELPDGKRIAVYSIWLPYSAEIWAAGTRDVSNPQDMLAACVASQESLTAMYKAIEARLADPKYDDMTVVIAGDFNSMSHLDYSEVGWDQYHAVIDWPTSHILTQHEFVDTYRACNPYIDRSTDSTWSPRFADQEQDRRDFVYSRSQTWQPATSQVIREHGEQFPSDHAAVITMFEPANHQPDHDTKLRAASYNIKHGRGMDNVVDLDRPAEVLRDLDADFIGLQEVDLAVTRSGTLNQANELAKKLDMHPAFGSFMDLQDGRYGMAVLSRHPIVEITPLQLPDGNEPRIALIVEARLPDGSTVLVVNVHFDWVDDDSFRFKQAETLANYLQTVEKPFILLGDFNDQPGSRTIALFNDVANEIDKPEDNRMTFPSDNPAIEIDFIWCGPVDAWETRETSVIAEPLASDHRPIVADVVLKR